MNLKLRWPTRTKSFENFVVKADFEKPCFSLELKIFKSTANDGEPAPAVETPSTSEISNQEIKRIDEREGNSDSQELEDFISAQKASNTVKKTKSDMRALKRFCSTIDETREPETKTAKELYKLFSRFFKDITKENGEEYEPSSLTSFQIFKPPTPDVGAISRRNQPATSSCTDINLDDSVKVHSASNTQNAVTSASSSYPSTSNALEAIIAGANISSVSDCTFQIMTGLVNISSTKQL